MLNHKGCGMLQSVSLQFASFVTGSRWALWKLVALCGLRLQTIDQAALTNAIATGFLSIDQIVARVTWVLAKDIISNLVLCKQGLSHVQVGSSKP